MSALNKRQTLVRRAQAHPLSPKGGGPGRGYGLSMHILSRFEPLSPQRAPSPALPPSGREGGPADFIGKASNDGAVSWQYRPRRGGGMSALNRRHVPLHRAQARSLSPKGGGLGRGYGLFMHILSRLEPLSPQRAPSPTLPPSGREGGPADFIDKASNDGAARRQYRPRRGGGMSAPDKPQTLLRRAPAHPLSPKGGGLGRGHGLSEQIFPQFEYLSPQRAPSPTLPPSGRESLPADFIGKASNDGAVSWQCRTAEWSTP
ncbi:hypothetical protein QO014_003699 [Kaistia dalseonensis]|uniref:Uncharacterized protein n=1 Tax=Kaistia dalseonensis TaxID=410840 RepID=A0ABU0HAF9_9HYPH|nr:hypothetical protein [Kaistia dalseonensis]